MTEDTNDKEEYYHVKEYLKPVYSCELCNLTMTTFPDDVDTQPCPTCGMALNKRFTPLTFLQSYDYATVSC